jgi:hypothetical protein
MTEDEIINTIRELIKENEFNDKVIDVIKEDIYLLNRNYNMKLRFYQLVNNDGWGKVRAIQQVADEFYIGYESAKKIIYKKKKNDKAA